MMNDCGRSERKRMLQWPESNLGPSEPESFRLPHFDELSPNSGGDGRIRHEEATAKAKDGTRVKELTARFRRN